MSLVISNMVTCALPKMGFSLASALMLRLFSLSCSLLALMYSQTFFVTSVRGTGLLPITAASSALGVMAFMKAALGVRLAAGAAAFFAGAAAFLAGAAAFTGAAAFLAGAFAGAFFAVAMIGSSLFGIWRHFAGVVHAPCRLIVMLLDK